MTPDLAVLATPPATIPGLIAELGAKGCRAAVVVTAGFGEGESKAGDDLQQRDAGGGAPVPLAHRRARTASASSRRSAASTPVSPISRRRAATSPWSPSRARSRPPSSTGRAARGSASRTSSRSATWRTSISATCSTTSPWTTARGRSCFYVESVTQTRKFMSAARIAARVQAGDRGQVGPQRGGRAGGAVAHRRARRFRYRLRRGVPPGRNAAGVRAARAVRGGDDAGGAHAARRRPARHPDQRRRRRGAGRRCARRARRAARRPVAGHRCRARRGAADDLVARQSGRHHRRRARRALSEGAGGDRPRAELRRGPGHELPDRHRRQPRRRQGGGRLRCRPIPTCRFWPAGSATAPRRRRAGCSPTSGCPPTRRRTRRCAPSCIWWNTGATRRSCWRRPPRRRARRCSDRGRARAVIDAALGEGRSLLTGPEAKRLLAAYGIPVVESRVAHDPEEAGRIAAKLGGSGGAQDPVARHHPQVRRRRRPARPDHAGGRGPRRPRDARGSQGGRAEGADHRLHGRGDGAPAERPRAARRHRQRRDLRAGDPVRPGRHGGRDHRRPRHRPAAAQPGAGGAI